MPMVSLPKKTQLPTQVVTGGHFQSDNQKKDWYYYTANGEKIDWLAKMLMVSSFILIKMANKSKDVLQRMVAILIKTLVHL